MSILARLFGKKSGQTSSSVAVSKPQPNVSAYVIGDIHGRADLLDVLLAQIEASDTTVTLGDYVDRGDNSAGVLETLMARQQAEPGLFVCLMGNHEKMMLDFLDRPTERGGRWIRNGGLQTLASFGVGGVTETAGDELMITTRDAFRKAMPDGLEAWLRALPKSWNSGNLWVVHAAADPSIPMGAQDDHTLMWGHKDFMRTVRADGCVVCHGHVITDEPAQIGSRVAIDTGAYYSERLTAAHFQPSGDVTFIQTNS